MRHDADAIVIGSGAGGLTAALALARAGKRVVVFEQHYLPGGWCHSFSLEGHQFSPGVHYIGELGPGGYMRAIYEGLGVANDLLFHELNPDGYDHIVIGAGRDEARFDIPKGKARFAERLCARFPRERAGIHAFLDNSERIAKELMSGVSARGWKEKATLPWRLRTTLRYGWMSLARFLDGFVKDPMLKAILGMQAGDHGLPPSRVPTAMHATILAHYFDGGWYPRGGAKALPKAFIKQLRAHGGQLHLSTSVARVLTEGAGDSLRTVGVRLGDGTEVRAPVVISNADPHVTLGRLVGRELLSPSTQKKLDRVKYSVSALSLFLAAELDARGAGLDSGNLWYGRTPDLEAIYRLAEQRTLSGDLQLPGVFLTTTTLKDPTKQKGRLHTMESFAFVSYEPFAKWAKTTYGERPEDYARMKDALTERMLDTIDEFVPGLRERVVFKALGTPLTNVHYCAATRGNLYGTEKTLRNLPPLGFSIKTDVSGLWMCGASTLGHGVAGATISGLAVAKAVLRCRRDELLGARGHVLRTMPAEAVTHGTASDEPEDEVVGSA